MTKLINRTTDCIGRVIVFGGKPELVLTPRETTHFANLAATKAAIEAAATRQFSGGRGSSEGAEERRTAAVNLRTTLRDIAEVAKTMHEEGVDIGAPESFRMPPGGSYNALVASGRGFAAMVEPREALFIARGLPATILADIETAIGVLTSAGEVRESGRSQQVGGTASLKALADEGMKTVRQLRASMRVKLRPTPGLLAEWKTASRVHRPLKAAAPTGSTPPPSGSGSGSGSGNPPPVVAPTA